MTSYAWDDAGRPASVTYPASGGTVEYAYDAAGRLDTITDWADRVTSYDYDDASRPTSITRPGDLVTTIGYDELDRPIDVDHVRSGTPILSQGYTYDANGNLATYTDDAGTATFGYDDLDRLTSAAFPGSQAYS
jgi:YD repeat-containing protein